ncbi:replication-relaxation family protein [Micromonospora sp. RTP1Z1]|uniref:replication-relaxation family protein n=1 Tax=Micromonospora sp. RTP1Z1 TaxID=2994043 RepID=UPI0029C96707|nr:replication-relaxation family protein [Micromonospora sp. RTP1Z1]
MADPVLRVQAQLTTRDLVLLGWLADHGVLTSFQIANALFPSVDYAQERLRTLTDPLGVMDRFRPQRPDGGSYPYHYVLAQLGVEVVAAQRGEDLPHKDRARRRRWHLTQRANLPHLLGVNGFFTNLAGHARTHPDSTLVRWWPAARCQQTGAFAEPGDDVTAFAYTARSRPDGHGIWAEGGRRVAFFLEFDLGTERPLSRLVDKLHGYHDLARTTGRFWPVLFSLPSPVRERHLHQELNAAGTRYPVATAVHADVSGTSPAEAVWWLHRADVAPLRLADLAPPNSSPGQAP